MTTVIEKNATAAPVKSDTAAPRLLDQVRERIRVLHYSRSTEKTYIHWILAFIRFHGRRHPRDMGAVEVEAYLSHLATARDVAAGTQNQTFAAVVGDFLDALEEQRRDEARPWLERDVFALFKVAILQFEDDGEVREPAPSAFPDDQMVGCPAETPHAQGIGKAVIHGVV